MSSPDDASMMARSLVKQIHGLKKSLRSFVGLGASQKTEEKIAKSLVRETGSLIDVLHGFRELISPVHFGSIGITLGRSDSIAKFFAFSFTNQEKQPLSGLVAAPFYGSGVYSIYYHGKTEKAYGPLSGTETPIYVGKADPKDPQAETTEQQGTALYSRLKEHVASIEKTSLSTADFFYRAAPIQTGLQSAVEEFMIRLFRPIWCKEVKICYGLGKHGDSATTRGNKRSPWDTMHPGRKWAAATHQDQMSRREIEEKIARHLALHRPIRNRAQLFKLLSLEQAPRGSL